MDVLGCTTRLVESPDFLYTYLARIGLEDSFEDLLDLPKDELLRTVQIAHKANVPFETIAQFMKLPVSLDTESLYEKIVENGCGGICYELNGGLALLLQALGFEVQLMAGEICYGSPGEFNHLFLTVQAEGKRWLVDAGFRKGAYAPLLFECDVIQNDAYGSFRIVKIGEGGPLTAKDAAQSGLPYDYCLQHYAPGNASKEWENLIAFYDKPRQMKDFNSRFQFYSTNDLSPFRKRVEAAVATPYGENYVSQNHYSHWENGTLVQSDVTSFLEFSNLLREEFGLGLREQTVEDGIIPRGIPE